MKNSIRACRVALAFTGFLFSSLGIFGQESRGTISGSVLDPAGAAIPAANVTATEMRTGVQTPTKSDASGHYNLPFLPPGEYQIEAAAAGFRSFVRRGITLASSDHPLIDLRLEVGQASQTVTVSADAPMLEVANSSISQSITTKEVEDFPLNGRNPMMVAQLAIGVIATGQPSLVHPFDNGAASAWSIGGTPSQTAEILMDGAPNATWDNRVAYAPPQDAVQEVKVKAFDGDASYGHTGSGTINQVMKTGTNNMHGSVYWFSQPSALAANSFFNNRAGIAAAETKLNQYGFTAGGPVDVPKVYSGKNKLFWFAAFERLTDSQPNTKLLTVPTAAERNGDFSALLNLGSSFQIYNPYSGVTSGSTVARKSFFCDAAGNPITPNLTPGAGFGTQATGTPCNKIPQQLLSPVASKYLQFYPQPNLSGNSTGYGNFANSVTTDDNYSNELGRIDWAMSDRSRLAFNVRHNNQLQSKNNYFNNNTTGSQLVRQNWGGSVDEVFTFSPTTVLDVRANYTRLREAHPSPNAGFDPTTLGFPAYTVSNSRYLQLPAISFGTSCGSDTTQAASFDCFGATTSDLIPSESYQIYGNVVKQLSAHTLKFGVDARRYLLDAQTFGASSGTYSFNNSWTNGPNANSPASNFGQDFAAFMLGVPTSGSYDVNTRGTYTSYYYALFVQDDWRIKHNLTINIGLRYDRDNPYSEKLGRTVNGFDTTSANPIAAAAIAAYSKKPIPQIPAGSFAVPGGLTFATPQDGSIWDNTSNLVSPRVGFAWSPDKFGGKTVFRGGFGMFVQPIAMSNLNPTGSYSSSPIVTQEGFSATTPVVIPSNFLVPSATLSNPFPTGFLQPTGSASGLATFNGQNITFFDGKMQNPYSERWTFGIQQELSPNLVMEIAYIGNHAVHLPLAFTQFNGIPRQYLSTLPYRDTAVNSALTASVANPFAGLIPGTSLNGSTTTVRQLLAPFPEFPVVDSTTFSSGVTERNANVGSSNFHSLSARVEKRLSQGLSLIGVYTWSKLMERDEWLNATDLAPEKRVSPFDHTNHFVLAANYELPIGRGKLINLESGWVNSLLGGWSTNAIYTYQTGAPILWMNGSTNNPGDYPLCAVATVAGACPNGGSGVPQAATTFPLTSVDSRQVNGASFDMSHFVTASGQQFQFHLRTLPTTYSNLRQDGINNFDASVIKRFVITESKYFQFRMEAFNVLNHPTFGAPNTQVTSANFGLITTQANRARQLQIGLRFVF
ncbi:MAG: TonB-dependent receptor [Acidobacteria bacterium]|nr:MAG: TonB-dependent receptor [Acidobacteriota bacterium]